MLDRVVNGPLSSLHRHSPLFIKDLKHTENPPQKFVRKDVCKRSEENYFHNADGRVCFPIKDQKRTIFIMQMGGHVFQ